MINNINKINENIEFIPKVDIYKSVQLDNYYMLILQHLYLKEKKFYYLCCGNITDSCNNTINYIFRLRLNEENKIFFLLIIFAQLHYLFYEHQYGLIHLF